MASVPPGRLAQWPCPSMLEYPMAAPSLLVLPVRLGDARLFDWLIRGPKGGSRNRWPLASRQPDEKKAWSIRICLSALSGSHPAPRHQARDLRPMDDRGVGPARLHAQRRHPLPNAAVDGAEGLPRVGTTPRRPRGSEPLPGNARGRGVRGQKRASCSARSWNPTASASHRTGRKPARVGEVDSRKPCPGTVGEVARITRTRPSVLARIMHQGWRA
jgi:hypothetical protein